MAGTKELAAGMREALRLVRSGHLRTATREIQSLLAGKHARPEQQSAPDEHAATSEHAVATLVYPMLEAPRVEARQPQGVPPADASNARTARSARARRMPTPLRAPLHHELHAPAETAGARPLLVMLHGCTQSAADFARGTRAAELATALGWYVLFPEQPARANGSRCWNWFRREDQARDAGEPRLLLDIIDDVAASHDIDPARVYVAGLSAGAAMAVVLAAQYPERFAAVAAHSGLPFAAAGDVPGAFAAMRNGGADVALPAGRFVPLLVMHGDADGTVTPANADRLVAQRLAAAPRPLQEATDEGNAGGRAFQRTRWRDAAGSVAVESWSIAGAGHAWSGGDARGSYTDAGGPDATRVMLDFFAQHAARD